MKKILIVDDEQISLLMTENILASEYKTVVASSGPAAIEVYKKEQPDMVLSDLHMGKMSGFELQTTLQKAMKRNIPFMFMTADSDDETESRGFDNGALDFIRKPFRADVLLRRVRNILETAEQIQGLRDAAVRDPMTGLLNKASSEQEIGLLCNTTSGTLLMIDLDSFKPVNDIYGHDAGDKILIRFAEIIRSAVRSTDLVGRMGGDEFITYCQNVRDEDVISRKCIYINDKIVESAREILGEDMTIPIGASIGCVAVPDEGTRFNDLFKKADKALYEVKQNGKHGFSCYHDAVHRETMQHKAATNLSNTLQILSERNPSAGAYTLPYEQFRVVYRFLKRLAPATSEETFVLLFSLTETGNPKFSIDDADDKFLSVLASSLRQSDVITQNGTSQFIILLFDTALYNIEIVIDRIMNNWNSSEVSVGYELSYELDVL